MVDEDSRRCHCHKIQLGRVLSISAGWGQSAVDVAKLTHFCWLRFRPRPVWPSTNVQFYRIGLGRTDFTFLLAFSVHNVDVGVSGYRCRSELCGFTFRLDTDHTIDSVIASIRIMIFSPNINTFTLTLPFLTALLFPSISFICRH